MPRRTDMPRGQRFPIEVMLRAMRDVDNGVPVSVVCRKVGMVEKTFYRYREKYAGMEATEARRLRELEEENARLKKLLSEHATEAEGQWDARCRSLSGQSRALAATRRSQVVEPIACFLYPSAHEAASRIRHERNLMDIT